VSGLRSGGWSILDTDGNRDGEDCSTWSAAIRVTEGDDEPTGCNDAEETDPR
jgi:hypothetical protein